MTCTIGDSLERYLDSQPNDVSSGGFIREFYFTHTISSDDRHGTLIIAIKTDRKIDKILGAEIEIEGIEGEHTINKEGLQILYDNDELLEHFDRFARSLDLSRTSTELVDEEHLSSKINMIFSLNNYADMFDISLDRFKEVINVTAHYSNEMVDRLDAIIKNDGKYISVQDSEDNISSETYTETLPNTDLAEEPVNTSTSKCEYCGAVKNGPIMMHSPTCQKTIAMSRGLTTKRADGDVVNFPDRWNEEKDEKYEPSELEIDAEHFRGLGINRPGTLAHAKTCNDCLLYIAEEMVGKPMESRPTILDKNNNPIKMSPLRRSTIYDVANVLSGLLSMGNEKEKAYQYHRTLDILRFALDEDSSKGTDDEDDSDYGKVLEFKNKED